MTALMKRKERKKSKDTTFKAIYLINGRVQFTPACWSSKSGFSLLLLGEIVDVTNVSNETSYQHGTAAQ